VGETSRIEEGDTPDAVAQTGAIERHKHTPPKSPPPQRSRTRSAESDFSQAPSAALAKPARL